MQPVPMLDVFARVMRGRVSSLRGLAAVGVGLASCVGPWPVVAWRCVTYPHYAAHVLFSLFMAPFVFWALLLHGFNAPVSLHALDTRTGPLEAARRRLPKPGSPEWGALNQERARLIRMKVRREPMTEGQRTRLAYLQEQTRKTLEDGAV